MDKKDYGEESPELLHARMIRLPFVSGASRGPATAVEAVHAEVVSDARIEERLNEHGAMIESLSVAFTRLSQIIEEKTPPSGGSPTRPAKKNWYSVRKGLGGIQMITNSWEVAKPYCKSPDSRGEFLPGIQMQGFETLEEAVKFMSA